MVSNQARVFVIINLFEAAKKNEKQTKKGKIYLILLIVNQYYYNRLTYFRKFSLQNHVRLAFYQILKFQICIY